MLSFCGKAQAVSVRRVGESELLDILQREAIVGVPGFGWNPWKEVLNEKGRSRAPRPRE